MNMQINFPNLGIFLENVGKSFDIFGFEIAFYGCTMATGILAGYLLAAKEAKRTGQNPDDYLDMLLYAVFFALVGARLYYVIFKWDYYGKNLLQILNLRQGGLAIYGGIIGAFTTVYFFAKKRKLSWLQMLDTACPGLAAGQVIGRWGNFFNVEAYGSITSNIFRMGIIENGKTIYVHPTFLYESIMNSILFVILFFLLKDFWISHITNIFNPCSQRGLHF